MGAGYGGAARYLARTFGCRVMALNLSEKENARNRQMNREQRLDHLIDVVDGSFEDVPADDASFDAVWSQEAFLHSGSRDRVVAEAARVLVPGGDLVFTDPMQADDCPLGVLQPVLERIHLDSLGSVAFYRGATAKSPAPTWSAWTAASGIGSTRAKPDTSAGASCTSANRTDDAC